MQDAAIEHFQSLNPHLFDFLDTLEVSVLSGDNALHSPLVLEMWLRPLANAYDDMRRLHLLFQGVVELKLDMGRHAIVSQLEIFSLKNDQWEHVKYRVHETEDDMLSFYCERFTAMLEETNDFLEDA